MCSTIRRPGIRPVGADATWQPQCVGIVIHQWQCNTLGNILHQHLSASCTAGRCSMSTWCFGLSKRFCRNFRCKLSWHFLAVIIKNSRSVCMQHCRNNNHSLLRNIISVNTVQLVMSVLYRQNAGTRMCIQGLRCWSYRTLYSLCLKFRVTDCWWFS